MGPLINMAEYFSVLSIWWGSSLKTNSRRLTYIFLSSLCDCPGNHSNCTALPLTHGEMVRLDEGRFPALELNNRRLSVKNSFCRKNGIYTRSVREPPPPPHILRIMSTWSLPLWCVPKGPASQTRWKLSLFSLPLVILTGIIMPRCVRSRLPSQ